MKRMLTILSIGIVILLILIITKYYPLSPQEKYYQDGGTVIITSLSATTIKFNTLEGCTATKTYYFPKNIGKSYNDFFQELCTNKIEPRKQTEETEETEEIEKTIKETTQQKNISEPEIQQIIKKPEKENFTIKSEDIQNATGFIYHKKYENADPITIYDNGFNQNKNRLSNINIIDQYIPDEDNNTEKNSYTVTFKGDTYTIIGEAKDKNGLELTYYHVYKNGEKIYTAQTKYLFSEPIRNFVVNDDGRWFLYEKIITTNQDTDMTKGTEAQLGKNTLVHNGKQLAYYDVATVQKIGGKTFYFFKEKKTSNIKYYFDGKIFETPFYDIQHDRCCSAGMYNLSMADDGRIALREIDKKIPEHLIYNEVILPGATTTKEELTSFERQAQLIKKREEEGELSEKEIQCKTELKNILSDAAHIAEYIATIDKNKVTGGGFRQVEASEIQQPQEKNILYFAVYEYHSDLGKEIMNKKYKLDLNNTRLYDISSQESKQIAIDRERLTAYKNNCFIDQTHTFQARGVLSFRAIEIKDNILTFSSPENNKTTTYRLDTIEKEKQYDYYFKGENIDGHFFKKDCVDSTKYDTWPYIVFVDIKGKYYRGCGIKK